MTRETPERREARLRDLPVLTRWDVIGRLLGGEAASKPEDAPLVAAIARRHLKLLVPVGLLLTVVILATLGTTTSVSVAGLWLALSGYGTMLRRSTKANEEVAHLAEPDADAHRDSVD